MYHYKYEDKQTKFQQDVLAVIDVFREHGNPFFETSHYDLVNIFNNVVFDEHVSSNLRNLTSSNFKKENPIAVNFPDCIKLATVEEQTWMTSSLKKTMLILLPLLLRVILYSDQLGQI